MGDYSAAADAFKRGIEVDPSNANLKAGLTNAEARIETIQPTSPPTSASGVASPGGGGLADMLAGLGGGAGGGGGGGGMPDIAAMLQNPMMMQMAQQMMADGGMERMMQNPAVANMVRALAEPRYDEPLANCLFAPLYRTDEPRSVRWRYAEHAGYYGRPVFARSVSNI